MAGLGKILRDYAALRHSQGYKSKVDVLEGFVLFARRQRARFITPKLAVEWARRGMYGPSPRRLTLVRGFAKFAASYDIRHQVPKYGLLRSKLPRRRPYFFSDSELRRLLTLARKTRGQPHGVRCYLLGLLAVTGMRLGEALRLENADVDLKREILTVRGKFGKSRLVPIHKSTAEKLLEYKRRRDEFLGEHDSEFFFVNSRRKPFTELAIERTFWRYLKQMGLLHEALRRPRIHDLRHRFAVFTIANLYQKNRDVEALAPALATYLGHVNLENTYWYISTHPRLMKSVMKKVDHQWREQ